MDRRDRKILGDGVTSSLSGCDVSGATEVTFNRDKCLSQPIKSLELASVATTGPAAVLHGRFPYIREHSQQSSKPCPDGCGLFRHR